MQIKFDIVGSEADKEINEMFIIDPYRFDEIDEKKYLTYFVKNVLCCKDQNFYKCAHGFYAQDFENIKS